MTDTMKIRDLTPGTRVGLLNGSVAEITRVEPLHIVEAKGGAFEVFYHRESDGETGQMIVAGDEHVTLAGG